MLANRGKWTRQKAMIMVLTLWIVVVLGVLATSLAFDVQVNSKLALMQREKFQAYNLARSAVALGMVNLQNDMLIDYQENPNQPVDSFADVWAMRDRREKDVEVEMGKGTYEVQIVDEEGKININRASASLIKTILEYYDYEAPDSETIANAIVDWRDADDMALGTNPGKENEVYSAMGGQKISSKTLPEELAVQCPNEDYLTIEELLDVFDNLGVDREIYYGYDPDAEEARELKMRNDVAMGHTTRDKSKRKVRGKKEQLALKDILTVQGSGRININTASEEVLTILFAAATGGSNFETAAATARSICDYRGDRKTGHAPDPEDAFKSAADLAKVSGVDQKLVGSLGNSGALGVQIGFSSNVFTVTGIGRVGSQKQTVSVLVNRFLETFNPDDAQLTSNKGSLRGRASRGNMRSRISRTGGANGATDNLIRNPSIRVLQWME
ncbi:MAG: general secretion pathway protein GspK [Candidatus Sumerlaeaceae bacterium]|nr:general secretion pathway protein GspK [Candidatus Sumerlaeaceae bacterium]